MKEVTIIAAAAKNNALGKDNKLIWHISDDLKRFRKLTLGHAVIMGRKTFESMPKALPDRLNIVITRNENYHAENILVCHDLTEAIRLTGNDPQPFIIGGGTIYEEGLAISDKIELTRIHHNFEADTFFPTIDPKQWKITDQKNVAKTKEDPYDYSYITYQKIKK